MMAKTYSATLLGVNAVEVEIECHEADGNQFRMTVVGLPDTAVKESRERVMAAVSTSGIYMPTSGYLTFNLAPADLRKEGPGFDLPMAISLVAGREKLALHPGGVQHPFFPQASQSQQYTSPFLPQNPEATWRLHGLLRALKSSRLTMVGDSLLDSMAVTSSSNCFKFSEGTFLTVAR